MNDQNEKQKMNEQNKNGMYQCQFIPPTPGVPPVAAAITPVEDASSPTIADGFFKDANNVFLGRDHLATSDVESNFSIESTEEERNKRNKNNRLTSTKINLDDIPEMNILLPLKSLIGLMETHFICRSCRLLSTETEYELETFGMATTLHARCSCGNSTSARAVLRPEAEEKIKNLEDGESYGNKLNAKDFDLNSKILLALQLGGTGKQELNNICGMLDIAVNPMEKQFTSLMDEMGLSILELAKEILDENLLIEKSFSPSDRKKRKILSVSNDSRWDKRGSGRRYDSMSGCSVMMGNRSKLIVGLEQMSMKCSKCESNTPHSEDLCSKNYDGSSKGMEACGALILVDRITETSENGCVIGEYVSDDDSSSRGILTHSHKAALAAGMITQEQVPRYNSKELGPGKGQPKPDIGKLPLDHPIIKMLADHNHRNRSHNGPLFGLARKTGGKNKGLTSVDCERYKRRIGWTLRLHTNGTFEEFKTAVLAVLEHHFDNHVYCGDWCKAKAAAEGEEKKNHSMRFRSKKDNSEMYEFMKEHHAKFMDEEALKQLYHQWNTNAVEGFNKLITKFLPKDRNYAKTIENKVRIHLAMSLLSLGYKRFYKRLFRKFGLRRGVICRSFLRSEDRNRQWRKHYRQKTAVKKARMALLYKKIREGTQKLQADNRKGWNYSTGMMGPGVDNEELSGEKEKKKKKHCKHCGKFGHQRKSHSDCDANPEKLKADNKKGLTDMGAGGNNDIKEQTGGKENNEKKEKNQCKHCGKFGHQRKSHSDCDANTKKVAAMRAVVVETAVEKGA